MNHNPIIFIINLLLSSAQYILNIIITSNIKHAAFINLLSILISIFIILGGILLIFIYIIKNFIIKNSSKIIIKNIIDIFTHKKIININNNSSETIYAQIKHNKIYIEDIQDYIISKKNNKVSKLVNIVGKNAISWILHLENYIYKIFNYIIIGIQFMGLFFYRKELMNFINKEEITNKDESTWLNLKYYYNNIHYTFTHPILLIYIVYVLSPYFLSYIYKKLLPHYKNNSNKLNKSNNPLTDILKKFINIPDKILYIFTLLFKFMSHQIFKCTFLILFNNSYICIFEISKITFWIIFSLYHDDYIKNIIKINNKRIITYINENHYKNY